MNSNIIHFGELRLKSGINHYFGDLYVIGSVYESEDCDSTLVVDGNLYVSGIACLSEIKVSGSIYANEISCSICQAAKDIYVETDLASITILAGGVIYVKNHIWADCTACFEYIFSSFVESDEVRTTFVECEDIWSTKITVDTLTVNGPLTLSCSPQDELEINARKICSSNINIG